MKVLIAADMEGITGVVSWDQVNPAHPEYARFRRLMTQDVNAAVRGAFDGGADEVVVTDGHNNGRNILIEELDRRARLNSGSPSPLSMVQGVDRADALMFIGYHARIGAENAILEHTWSDERVYHLHLNGQRVGEIGLNAAVAGQFGVPLILISGDQTACAEARALLGELETAVVKTAVGRMAAELLAPAASQELIQAAAQRAVQNFIAGQHPAPFQPAQPVTVAVDFVQSEMAEKAALLPGAVRDERRVNCSAATMVEAYRAFRALLALARG
ncbi:MAG: M55 family metallopeptidase [Chloroflexota bacterium]